MVEPSRLYVEEGKSPLRTLRELLGDISQEELARRLGVSVVTISRWERGVTPATFTVPQMKALMRELRTVGLDIEDFPNDLGPLSKNTNAET